MTDQSFDPQREATRILAAIVETSDDAIIGKDLNGTILTWNRGAERTYGYTAREMIGRSILAIVPPERHDEFHELMRRIAAGEHIAPFDTIRVTKSGERLDVWLSLSAIHDDGGRIVGVSAIGRDFTAQRRGEAELRNAEARWRGIIQTAADGIVLIDRHGRIELFNPAAERLFGLRASDVIGANVSTLMPAEYAARHDGYLAEYGRTGTRHIIGIGRDVDCRRADGSVFSAHLSIAEIVIDGEPKFVGLLRDLTEQLRMEQRLRDEAGLVRIGELAAVLAHEIRNTLAAVSGAIQMLSEHLAGEEERAIGDEVLRRLDGLNSLMNDLLMYARPPRPQLIRLSLTEVLENLMGLLPANPIWQGIDAGIRGSAGEVAADPELLKLAFQNVLLNAAQAMRGTGTVRIEIRSVDGRAEVDFIDNGPGIPPDVRAKLFTPFFTTKSRGTGLGLATVRRIAEAHGGDVRILESTGPGTTVRISFPVVEDESS